jgi:hypothetical protein
MDADFSIELGHEDAALDFPWSDPAGRLAYINLKRNPELLQKIQEAQTFPELGAFLRTLNSPRSMVETAKCDAWATTELTAEEEIHNASHKFASYVDAVFSDEAARLSLPAHEQFVRKLIALLNRAPDMPSAAEVCIRRCYFAKDEKAQDQAVQEGCYCTIYVSGYGNDPASARQNWEVGLKLVGSAILQTSRSADTPVRGR